MLWIHRLAAVIFMQGRGDISGLADITAVLLQLSATDIRTDSFVVNTE